MSPRKNNDGYGHFTIQSLGSVEIDPVALAKGRAYVARKAPDLMDEIFGDEGEETA